MTNGADYERGRREAALEGRMSVLEARLAEQGAGIAHLTGSLEKLDEQVAALTVSMKARTEVDRALKDAAEAVTKRGINRRDLWLGVAAVVITLGIFLVSLLATVQH